MDLGVLLESPQGSQSSSRVGTCTCAFLSSCSSSVTLPFEWINGSVAFTRGFPTGLSHVPPWCGSILSLKVDAVQGKQVSLEWTETSGGLWEWWHDPGVPLAFPVESLPLEMRGERREFFPDHAGKGSLLSSYEAETGLLWMWAGLSCFLSSCISSVTLPFSWIKGSVAFTRGFPTGLSHVPPWCESILGLKVEAVQGKQVSL